MNIPRPPADWKPDGDWALSWEALLDIARQLVNPDVVVPVEDHLAALLYAVEKPLRDMEGLTTAQAKAALEAVLAISMDPSGFPLDDPDDDPDEFVEDEPTPEQEDADRYAHEQDHGPEVSSWHLGRGNR